MRDITAFLQYAGEPAALKRESMGVWVLLYLAFFTFLAYLLKHEFCKDGHWGERRGRVRPACRTSCPGAAARRPPLLCSAASRCRPPLSRPKPP